MNILKDINFLNHRVRLISKLYPYLWSRDKAIRWRFVLAISLLLITILLNIGVPVFLKHIINVISLPTHAFMYVEVLLASYGVIWTLSKITDQMRLIAINRVIERGMRTLCLNIFNHLLGLSFRFHSTRKTGALLSVIDRSQFAFWPFFCGLFFFILPTLIEIIAVSIILVVLYGFSYGCILLLTLTGYMIFSFYGSKWSSEAQASANEKTSAVSSKIVDSLLNYETIRHFVNQQYEQKSCDNLLLAREDASTKQHARAEFVTLGQGIIMGIGLIILTVLSGLEVIKGTLRISDFVLINVYLLQFMTPLGHFGYILRDMNEGLTNLNEVITLLDEKSEVQDKSGATKLICRSGEVVFDKVNFSYDSHRSILKDISFKIPAKKTVAIVGASGSGKSTIAKLLFRYADITRGCITIDGQDIRSLKQYSLQSHIGIVPQHTALFNDTLRYNISYGKIDATDAELNQAIRQAHLDVLVNSLPNGLDTMVGEYGFKLSGGERQRVAIARVLLKNSPILIFDEATSSLDTKTEQAIQANIEEVAQNVTTLIIAHRLSTIVHADEILVLEEGRIVERGTHSALLKKNGHYTQLWKKQSHHD